MAPADRLSNTNGVTTLPFLLAYSLCLALFFALIVAPAFRHHSLFLKLEHQDWTESSHRGHFEPLGVNPAPRLLKGPLLAALCEASLAMTLDLDIRGSLSLKDFWIEFALAKVVESLLATLRFFTGVGMPECWGNNRGLVNIWLEFAEKVSAEWRVALLIVAPRGGCCRSSETAFNPPAPVEGRPLSFASELAVGANSREVIEENLENDPVAEDLEVTEAPPKGLFEPILLTPPVEDILVDDTHVPIENSTTTGDSCRWVRRRDEWFLCRTKGKSYFSLWSRSRRRSRWGTRIHDRGLGNIAGDNRCSMIWQMTGTQTETAWV